MFWRKTKPMASFTELQAQQEYKRYQDSVMTNDRVMTFLEWVLATKIVLRDVDPEEFAELLT
jgi:hypothetical protein